MSQDPVVIVSAARTPMGAFQGDFASLAAHDLGGVAIAAAVARAGGRPGTSACKTSLIERRPTLVNRCRDVIQDVRLGYEGNHVGA